MTEGSLAAADVVAAHEPALSERAHQHLLKYNNYFALFDARGDCNGHLRPLGPAMGTDGLFHHDTRILSRLALRVSGSAPVLLTARATADQAVFTAHLANPQFEDNDDRVVPQSHLHILRRRVLGDDGLLECIQVENYGGRAIDFDLSVETAADFRDIFEVRGAVRDKRGQIHPARVTDDAILLAYEGRDDHRYETRIAFSRTMVTQHPVSTLSIRLDAGSKETLVLHVTSAKRTRANATDYMRTLRRTKRALQARGRTLGSVETDAPSMTGYLLRAARDLNLLTTQYDTGLYPHAGVPWFAVPFGRDAIITAFQTLWLEPALTLGVLRFLAATQATARDAASDAEPGKIIHEIRDGEMARTREVPFLRYYGSADATPLFVALAGAYLKRTDDLEAIARLWPALEAAIAWLEAHGDRGGDGFIEYDRASATGILNQGWKDSADSICHADGAPAEPPIALIEVQAYAIAAYEAAAFIAGRLGHESAQRFAAKARALREMLEEAFWDEALGIYGIALDRDKRLCRVRSTNAGHALYFAGVDEARAARLAASFKSPTFYTGWGIRTTSSADVHFNPMSYHNGSVWPHDTAIVGAGMARYGETRFAARLLSDFAAASEHFPDHRLPELYCGFAATRHGPPVNYPSACTVQAWASGAPFLLLQAALGLSIDAAARRINFQRPCLPAGIDRIRIPHLSVGASLIDLNIRRENETIAVSAATRAGDPPEIVVAAAAP